MRVSVSSMDTIQIRVDAKTKKAAKKLFAEMGMDLSTGIKLYLAQALQEKGLPFQPRTVNGFTLAKEARMIRETEWAEKYGKRYNSAKELLDDVLK